MRYEDTFDGKVKRCDVTAALELLGLNATDVLEVHMRRGEIEVTSILLNGMPIHKALMPIEAGEPLRARTRLLIED